ncbi:histone-lysine N-methyltransferase [Acrasis kona]|uniref:Histone-lysine N-methyltransferase n=1 Tax=Acrasis kona TaxID=1008807 RepID=A0AAW2ZN59_9EUKA
MNETSDHPQLPLRLGPTELFELGIVEYKRSEFHSSKYIYPIGFRTQRQYFSYKNKQEKTIYTCEILDNEEYNGSDVIFKVTPLDDPEVTYQSTTASGAWLPIIKLVGEGKRETFTVSGPEYFGLSNTHIKRLIEALPNAKKCTRYKSSKRIKNAVTPIKKNVDVPRRTPKRKKQEEDGDEPEIKQQLVPSDSPARKRKSLKPKLKWCSACGKTVSDKTEHSSMLQCSRCPVFIHDCCHIPSLSLLSEHQRATWLCDNCKSCEVCNQSTNDDVMLICETCDRAFHTFCMVPPLESIPQDAWYCKQCTKVDDDNDIIINQEEMQEQDTFNEPQEIEPKSQPEEEVSEQDSNTSTEQWNERDDVKLYNAVNQYGGEAWDTISSIVKKFSTEECRDRYYLLYMSMLDQWNAEEDERLLKQVEVMGEDDWDGIVVEGRTIVQCMDRYKTLIKQGEGNEDSILNVFEKIFGTETTPDNVLPRFGFFSE